MGSFSPVRQLNNVKGTFVSDREIPLPGLFRRRRLIAQEIEKIIVQDSFFSVKGLFVRQYQVLFLLEREAHCEFLVSGEERRDRRFDQAVLSSGGSDDCRRVTRKEDEKSVD